MSEPVNAVISSTHLGFEDHGIFTASVMFSGAGWGQGLGNYFLGKDNRAAIFITRMLKTLGVESWEKVKGTTCRIRRENGLIVAVGHLIEDRWFVPKEELS